MGVVYRAHDERLKRDVALKVISAGMLGDETARSRFRREALTLSQLNHPNIAVVHDFDSEQGVDFLVMEYVEGETLAAKIAERCLPEKDVIALGMQIAEALEEAHEHQIVHRDLKPGNVIVTPKGRAKVLDFGLAKLLKPVKADAATASLAESRSGVVTGTVPYMAPEQLQGEAVDGRTDLYALGALMYEMATGRRPFPEKQASQLIAAILTQPPQPPRKLNGKVSPQLEAIILKAIEKSPKSRYQSARGILDDLGRVGVTGEGVGVRPRDATLRWSPVAPGSPLRRQPARWAVVGAVASLIAAFTTLVALNVGGLRDRWLAPAGASPPRIRSVAVLPLENLSGDPQQDYFADGMTDELIADLAQVSALRVISRTSVMQYKNTKKPTPQIAKELHVDAVVEGSVLREGGEVRINAELINAKTDQNLWAQSYERNVRSVLTLQSEIARAVASHVRATLSPDERSRLASRNTVNPEAYDAYLKGEFFLNKMTPEGFDKGLQYMRQAIKKDPSNPMPYAGLAVAYTRIGHAGSSQAFPKAKAAALKAEKLGGPSAEMYLALGTVELESDWNFAAAEKDLKRAVELNPSLGEAHRNYSWYLVMRREPEKAIEEMKRAQEVEPLTPLFAADLAWQYWTLGQLDKAIEAARSSLELQPNFDEGLAVLGFALGAEGKYAEAIAIHQKLAALDSEWRWALPYTYARAGQKTKARETLARFLKEKPKPTAAWAGWFVAATYGELGDKDEAFRWLDAAYQAHHTLFPWIRTDPLLPPLRSDPRFQDLVRRMNFPKN